MKTPIKRNKNLVPLSKNHHVTLLFCWKIRSGLKLNTTKERIKNYISYFWQTHMQPHFYEEETILFTPVQDAAVQRALNEHAAIRNQIDFIMSAQIITDEHFKKLADDVDNHVRYEERELFPHLEKILSDEQLQNIGDSLEKNHAVACSDDFADEFWNAANKK